MGCSNMGVFLFDGADFGLVLQAIPSGSRVWVPQPSMWSRVLAAHFAACRQLGTLQGGHAGCGLQTAGRGAFRRVGHLLVRRRSYPKSSVVIIFAPHT